MLSSYIASDSISIHGEHAPPDPVPRVVDPGRLRPASRPPPAGDRLRCCLPARRRHVPRPRRGPPRHPRRRQGAWLLPGDQPWRPRAGAAGHGGGVPRVLPAAGPDKAAFYSEDKSKPNRLFSGSSYETLGERYWRDCLRLVYPLPAGDTRDRPHKPQRLREVVGNYAVLARGLATEILRLLCEGMGLRPDYFVGDISGGRVAVDINLYPPCPNPSRTLGLPPHCDRDLITILLPGAVPGLEVAYKGEWIKVQPVPNSFVVNFGLQLEVRDDHIRSLRIVHRSSFELFFLGLHAGCDQRDAQERGAPRGHQLGGGEDVGGDVHRAGGRLRHRPRGGVRRRGQPAVLPHPQVRRLQADAQCRQSGVLAQPDHEPQEQPGGGMKQTKPAGHRSLARISFPRQSSC
ncbi:mugineic-acid 3-dioxygenase-like [Panicum miliaceum]|uniref:Mugineic-acid 3-dioxygenase-like n=1 Tax=Panicum miliaceum TaxID=4540 RepID=A0A3L6RCU6_PANMI|nr:mugineic-acid 3-dioxygenase-like [Panicum miliaceum]